MDVHRFTASRPNLSIEEKIIYLQQSFRVTDAEANSVLHSCDEDLEQAVNLLWSMHSPQESSKSTSTSTPTPGDGASVESNIDQATGTELNPIDLTTEGASGGDPDPELQHALALSIQQMNNNQQQSGLSIEEEELSRAVEASLAANQANLSRLGLPKTSLFVDPKNPHERKREGNTAVGLKNIGNTCWFSAVVQSLLHIPVFCEQILGYSPPPLTNGITEYSPSVNFVLELQKLFGMLILSPRKYVDPNFVIQAFKEVFTKEKSHAGAQQDVSEFTHKLLEWIEEAFSHSLGENVPNPMVGLFTGLCKREGTNNGEEFHNEEDFGALHVQVNNNAHVHDCLGAYTFNPEVNQETWFKRLPPVLVLSLSRFKYNQNSGQAEKVHDQLKFDLTLSMDRYLEINKEESLKRRKEVAKLKERLLELNGRLNNYIQYNNKPVSVMESLSLTLNFIHEQDWCGSDEESGERAEKRARISLRPSPRSVSAKELTTLEGCLSRWIKELTQDVKDLEDYIAAAQSELDAVYVDDLMNSTPYHLHAVMVHQGQASGGHYWAYVRKNHACLLPKTHESKQTDTIPEIEVVQEDTLTNDEDTAAPIAKTGQYSTEHKSTENDTQEPTVKVDPVSSMENSPKSLPPTEASGDSNTLTQHVSTSHHEGMDVEGEQSTDVQSNEDVWLKFNDVAVSEVSWEDVQKESYGGSRNTSAYCLIYVNKDLHEQFTKKVFSFVVRENLQRYVDRDADDFRTEISEYDERAIQAATHIPSSTEVPRASIQPPSPSSGGAPTELADAAQPEHSGLLAHSHIDRSPEQMQVDSPPLPPVDPQLADELKLQIEEIYTRMSTLYQGKFSDFRLAHTITYAIHSGASKQLIKGLVLEMVIQLSSDPAKNQLRILAQKEFLALFAQHGMQRDIDRLRWFYNNYCVLCWNYIQAVKYLRESKWEGSLSHSLQAYNVHLQICKAGSAQFSLIPAHLNLLITLRRRALQKVSDLAYDLFEDGHVQQALKFANELLVPCLAWFSATTARDDEGLLENVREKWCQCLTQPGLTDREQDQLGDLLTRMFEESGRPSSFVEPSLPQDFEHHAMTVELANALTYLLHQ